MQIKCLITDDEPLAIDVLANYVQSLDYLSLEGRCNNAIETLNFLKKNTIDLLFLDIQMPKLNGMEMLRTLTHPPKIILTTAFRDYALEGYELNVLDYLLKPISFDRFLMAVNKYYQYNGVAANSDAQRNEPTDGFLYVRAQKKMIKVWLNEIVYIESLRDYIRIKTLRGEVITHSPISQIEEKLSRHRFLRIHRSFIVSLDKIETFTATTVELGSLELPIGRYYKPNVLSVLQSISP